MCLTILWNLHLKGNKVDFIWKLLKTPVKVFKVINFTKYPFQRSQFCIKICPIWAIFSTWNSLQGYKKLTSRSCSRLFTLTYFFHSHTFTSTAAKQKVMWLYCLPQQIRLQATVQLYILWDYSSVRIGFSINKKCHTLAVVYTMLV